MISAHCWWEGEEPDELSWPRAVRSLERLTRYFWPHAAQTQQGLSPLGVIRGLNKIRLKVFCDVLAIFSIRRSFREWPGNEVDNAGLEL